MQLKLLWPYILHLQTCATSFDFLGAADAAPHTGY